jgi:hypothetical protein
MHELGKAIEVGWHSAGVDERSVDATGIPIKTLAAEIQSGVHTHLRDLLGSRPIDGRSLSGRPSLIASKNSIVSI